MIKSLIKLIFGYESGNSYNKQSRAALAKKFDSLVRKGFPREATHKFCSETTAQELPFGAFNELIISGPNDIISHFFELNSEKPDLLDEKKVNVILSTPGLVFCSDKGEVEELEGMTERALRLITSYADFTPEALAEIAIVGREVALAIIAQMPELVLENEIIASSAAHGAGFKPGDVKFYCRDPKNFKCQPGRTITTADVIVLEALAKWPSRKKSRPTAAPQESLEAA